MPWSRSDTTDFDSDIGNDIDWEQWYGGADVESTDVGTEAQYSATTVFASDEGDGDNSSSWQDEYSDRDDECLPRDSQSSRPQHRGCEVAHRPNPFNLETLNFSESDMLCFFSKTQQAIPHQFSTVLDLV